MSGDSDVFLKIIDSYQLASKNKNLTRVNKDLSRSKFKGKSFYSTYKKQENVFMKDIRGNSLYESSPHFSQL